MAVTRNPSLRPADSAEKAERKEGTEPLVTPSETKPARAGPRDAPRSPANAKKANIFVPAPRICRAPRLYVPGQSREEAMPASIQPTRERIGEWDRAIIR